MPGTKVGLFTNILGFLRFEFLVRSGMGRRKGALDRYERGADVAGFLDAAFLISNWHKSFNNN